MFLSICEDEFKCKLEKRENFTKAEKKTKEKRILISYINVMLKKILNYNTTGTNTN